MEGDDVKFTAGRDLRCYIRSVTDATFMLDDLGGYWEGIIGEGRTKIRLKAGGDVTLVTDRDMTSRPPSDVRQGRAPERAGQREWIDDREIAEVDDLQHQFCLTTRTLQWLFSGCVGVSPGWVIRRYRLQDAADHLDRDEIVERSRNMINRKAT